MLVPIHPDNSVRFFDNFLSSLKTCPSDAVIRAGFAYATVGGVEAMIQSASDIPQWAACRKEFVVGVHQAITEPFALDMLTRVDKAIVRVFLPGRRLAMESFSAKPTFHPKVIAISANGEGALKFIQAGSANLTSAAVGAAHSNIEFAVSQCEPGSLTRQQSKSFHSWWTTVWSSSRLVNYGLIENYAKLRRSVMDRNPILRTIVDAPACISTAEFFFCEVGAGSGPPGHRHQVEFPESLARFFGTPERAKIGITLRQGQNIWSNRPLSYKQTTFGVGIWRLGMPTEAKGGEPIADRAILFQRLPGDSTFGFTVCDVGGPKYEVWAKNAHRLGHLGATHGSRSRQYGFY